MQQACKHCQASFQVTDDDLQFLKDISPVIQGKAQLIPAPTLCPSCRLQRRLALINQTFVCTRPSSISNKRIFSMFPEEVPFPVYENDYWWSDAWNALDYGKEPDPSRSFFDQYRDLERAVPHFALMTLQNEDCEYCNNVSQNKHCYLCFNTRRSEDCVGCERTVACVNCLDCTGMGECERCFNCAACIRCYGLQESQACTDCTDSFFLLNCRSCTSCFGCTNLRHAEFCVFNRQYTRENYQKFMRDINLASHKAREEWRAKTLAFWHTQPRPHAVMTMTEDVSGNELVQCKNVHESYFVRDGENLRYCAMAFDGVKNCGDFTTYGDQVEHVYESARCGNRFSRSAFCHYCYDGCSDLFYCSYCVGCQDCFGCVGLRKKRFCMLNKQYSQEEYHARVAGIIALMREQKQWGEFFPITQSSYPYNITLAQRYFPITRAQSRERGLAWHEQEMASAEGAVAADSLPDIASSSDEPLVVKSAASGKPFRVTTQERKHYAAMKAPLPRTTYAERMEERAQSLGGVTLYDRMCAKTGKPIRTVIPPGAPWTVWDKDEYEREFSA